jgi:flagellum-specific ATP synthase
MALRKIVATYREVEDLIQIGAYRNGSVPETDAAVAALPTVNQFLQQPVGQPSDFQATTERLQQIGAAFETMVRSSGISGNVNASGMSEAAQ